MRVPTYFVPLAMAVSLMCFAQQTPTTRAVKISDRKAITATEDEAGCVDSPALARVPGCKILQCAKKSDDAVEIAVAATVEGLPREVEVDGASESIYYLCAGKDPGVDIVPVLQASLVKDGYTMAFAGKDRDDDSVVSASKAGQWIQISTYVYDAKPAYLQVTLKATPEEFVSVEDFEDQFPATLRVFLPSVKFAAGKSVLTPACEKVLDEVVKLLAKRPEWKLRVDAYATDGGVDPAANLTLSKARAATIVDWFVGHGVDKERLDANGMGDTVAIPDGKQRIELVKM